MTEKPLSLPELLALLDAPGRFLSDTEHEEILRASPDADPDDTEEIPPWRIYELTGDAAHYREIQGITTLDRDAHTALEAASLGDESGVLIMGPQPETFSHMTRLDDNRARHKATMDLIFESSEEIPF